ncbi:four helix bundle protein [Roseivirga thermotolerans]|uniref:four helix bundle protein n=1 Tax=Roseivirga thermotolerans TaxID=1758176 RepID=UPI00273EB2B7|nr:four helix bundle protein [Roseivirga thermotolerans]
MALINKIGDLKIWQGARVLDKLVFEFLYNNSYLKDYDLKNQVNSASGSIMDNIAEGFGRGGNKEFRQFLTVARGFCAEVRSQVIRATDRNYTTIDQSKELLEKLELVTKTINGFIKYLYNTDLKGSKYKVEEEASDYGFDLKL